MKTSREEDVGDLECGVIQRRLWHRTFFNQVTNR